MHGACGVIDTACTVHAVSLTPDARCMQNSNAMEKIKNAFGVIDTACMIIAFENRIQKGFSP
jgi:hypothetical protein